MQSKFFNTPFATAGDKIDIPDAAQVDGSVSFATGFGPDYEKELGVDPDAKPVPRDATNGVLYDITDALGAIQKQGAPQFIEAVDNGGTPFSYGRGARVMYGAPARPWVSRVDNNTTTPAAGANWQLEVFEVATNAQAIAGTDPTVMINPPALAAALATVVVAVPDASESVKGIQRNATQSEANAGALDNATMTPLKTAGAIAQQVPAATTVVAGRVRLATVPEAGATSSAVLAVTPAGLAQTKTISWINGLQAALDAKFNTAGGVVQGPLTMGGELRLRGSDSGGSDLGGVIVLYRNSADTVSRFYQTHGNTSWSLNALNDAQQYGGSLVSFQRTTLATTFGGSATAAGGFQNGSSRTIKDHVADIEPAQALRNVLALRAVTYRYHGCDVVRAGYYAEEVRESRPEAVTDAGEGSFSPLLLEDAQMLPDHTGAIQELYRMILELKEKSK